LYTGCMGHRLLLGEADSDSKSQDNCHSRVKKTGRRKEQNWEGNGGGGEVPGVGKKKVRSAPELQDLCEEGGIKFENIRGRGL